MRKLLTVSALALISSMAVAASGQLTKACDNLDITVKNNSAKQDLRLVLEGKNHNVSLRDSAGDTTIKAGSQSVLHVDALLPLQPIKLSFRAENGSYTMPVLFNVTQKACNVRSGVINVSNLRGSRENLTVESNVSGSIKEKKSGALTIVFN